MVDYNQPFCYYHQKTAENPKGTDCTARPNESNVFKCPFNLIDVHYKKKRGYFIVKKAGHRLHHNPNGDCPDFVLKGLKPELADKLKDASTGKKLETLLMLIMSGED